MTAERPHHDPQRSSLLAALAAITTAEWPRLSETLLARTHMDGCSGVEVCRSAMVAFIEWLQSRLRRTVWSTTTSCSTAGVGRVASR